MIAWIALIALMLAFSFTGLALFGVTGAIIREIKVLKIFLWLEREIWRLVKAELGR